MLVLTTTGSLTIPSKAVVAQQQQGEETRMMSMDKMMQNMTEEQLSKKIMQTIMDEIKRIYKSYHMLINSIFFNYFCYNIDCIVNVKEYYI